MAVVPVSEELYATLPLEKRRKCMVRRALKQTSVLMSVVVLMASMSVLWASAAPKVGDYEILFQWNHLDWKLADEAMKADFEKNEYWKGAMPAGFKVDAEGNYYLSVPRWAPGIPATLNKVVMADGKPVLEAFPSWEMNEVGNPDAIQSVLGYEIDENGVMWILDQGHVNGAPSIDGSQKLVLWDLKANTLIESVKIPTEIAPYAASFLNDLAVDNQDGFVYIADSGIFSDPLQGGLIVYNMQTKQLRRVLNQHESVQDVPGFWFKIAGKKVWKDTPMRTGADGIALSADRKTLYWCPLTGRNLYAIETAFLQDFNTPMSMIKDAVRNLGSKGTNTDGMTADNQGNIYYTMLEEQGVGIYNPATGFKKFITDDRMVWVDGICFDNKGYILFNNNRLHELFGGELDWNDPTNLIIWKAYVGEGVKSYLLK
ncbi:RBAM01754 protein [Candidatus Vecturithrix granuli]|uniref:RBAM01754 protein n=1 Tax=Vecturithrix granuli TaxID=1499967 RepID=A0A0S6WAH3_VECG1|nr:RBAM01754 protein [Candidatus Vecturithrix granuli]